MSKEEKEEELPEEFKQLTELAIKLGWQFAIPHGGGPEDDGLLHGMIIGEESYINYILGDLD